VGLTGVYVHMGLRHAWVAAVALVALSSCGESEPQHSPAAPHRTGLAVWRVYMGVSCGKPNSIRCDRVGLAVWLPRRARRLEASIGGRPLELRWGRTDDATDYGATKHRRVQYYEGFLQPAGLIDGPLRIHPDGGRYHWTGRVPVSAQVRLIARYRGGKAKRRTLSVPLAAGWG
jgi:hypothetical protein